MDPSEPADPRLARAVTTLIDHWLHSHPELAPSIGVLAEWVAARAKQVSAPPTSAGEDGPSTGAPQGAEPAAPTRMATVQPAAIRGPVLPAFQQSRAFVPLKFGDTAVQLRVPGTSADIAAARFSVMESAKPAAPTEYTAPDLALIAERCELKARACLEAIVRRSAPTPELEQASYQRLRGIILEAKERRHCFIWVTIPNKPVPPDAVLTILAGAYRNLGAAATQLERNPAAGHRERRGRALQFLAEAQSALRVALEDTWLMVPDADQDDAFHYLHDATKYEGFYLPRFMRLEDAADPAHHEELRGRIAAFGVELDTLDAAGKKVKAQLDKISYHARRLPNAAAEDAASDWERIDSAVAELGRLGVARTDERMAARIAGLTPPQDAELAALRAALAANIKGEEEEEDDSPGRAYSERVARARALLEGQRVVIIGGERRDETVERIRAAFNMAELEWATVNEHTSSTPLEAPIRRPETRLVIILIRLAGHLHVDDVTAYCEKWGKPLVRLPAGYGVERIAAEVLEQASGKLEAESERSRV